jgi:hypothetical protein
MKSSSQWVAFVLVATFGLQSVAWGASGAQAFHQEIQRFQTQVDLGLATPQAALQEFTAALASSGITTDDLRTVLKSRLSPREYAKFQSDLATWTHGLDFSTLSADEQAELIQAVLSGSRSQGLSWSPCQSTYRAAGFTALAAMVLLIVVAVRADRHGSDLNKMFQARRDAITADYKAQIDAAATAADVQSLEAQRDAALQAVSDQQNNSGGDAEGWAIVGAVGSGIGAGFFLGEASGCDSP